MKYILNWVELVLVKGSLSPTYENFSEVFLCSDFASRKEAKQEAERRWEKVLSRPKSRKFHGARFVSLEVATPVYWSPKRKSNIK